ncbi:MAG: hypothetical protein A4E50_01189 [Methanosaeta sp. PtaB.Bin087]|nr:MAG: hypothetical protein A4E50_01189 [Methanosaeta sp. PtaB.Bin087]
MMTRFILCMILVGIAGAANYMYRDRDGDMDVRMAAESALKKPGGISDKKSA